MDRYAQLRRAGVLFIDHLIKESQLHPVENLRRSAAWEVGLHDLQDEFGIDPADALAHKRALVSNPEYFQRLRSLYDKWFNPQAGSQAASEAAATQKNPANIEAENAPKVVAVPK